MSKPIPAIIETELDQLERETRKAIESRTEAVTKAGKLETQLAAAHETIRMRTLEVGQLLVRARAAYPKAGTKAKGWGEYLNRLGIDQPRAWEWMKYAGYVELSSPAGSGDERPALPSFEQAGLRNREDAPTPPPPRQVDEPDVDRDTWCTPKEIARAIGRWDLDPCSNERSHIDAAKTFRLDVGEDGLKLAGTVDAKKRVFINPPYSDVGPWIEAYGHARFCFLLKFDPSTKWFASLMKIATFVMFPRGTRVEFEPPPGVPPEKSIANPFPHALFYAREADVTDAVRSMCFPGWTINRG